MMPVRRTARDRVAMRTPPFGDLVRQRSLAAFIRMLRKLYNVGVGPVRAWEGAMNVAPNSVIRGKLIDSYDIIQQNIPIHDAFTATGLFANETEQLLSTGVVTGNVVEALDKVADYYQDNVDRAVRSSRFWMWRWGIVMFMVLIGAYMIIFAQSYVDFLFNNPFVQADP